MNTKLCTKCGIEKPESEFHIRLNGRQAHCKDCVSAYYTARYANEPDFRANKLIYATNPEYRQRGLDRNKRRYKVDAQFREDHRRSNYYSRYGITTEEYEGLAADQNYVCALCNRSNPSGKRLAVDHDHNHHSDPLKGCKDCIRGLLCSTCNQYHLPWLERNPHLQNEVVKRYLVARPFQTVRLLAVQSA